MLPYFIVHPPHKVPFGEATSGAHLELSLFSPQANHDALILILCLLQGSLLGRHHLGHL